MNIIAKVGLAATLIGAVLANPAAAQCPLSDTLVPDSATGFPIAGQTMTDDYHDAFPDEGQQPLAFPG